MPDKIKFSLHDLRNVNTALGLFYDKDGNYRAGFKAEEFYNTILLDTLKYGEENFVHLKYAETVNIRKGEKVARFRRWAGMTPTLRPLMEGLPPAPDKHAYEYMEVGNVFSFGRWSEYTDQIDMSVVSDIISERSLQYGENANQTKELYARKTWLSSPNEYFANFKDGFADLTFGDSVTIDDLRFLIARMKRMQVKPVSGKFNYICSQEFINGLIDDPRVKMYMEINQTTGNLWTSGECFPLFDINFIPTMLDEFAYPDTEFPGVYEASDGKEWIRLYAVAKPGTYTYTDGGNEVSATLSGDNSKVFYIDIRQDLQVGTNATDTAKTVWEGYLPDGTNAEGQDKWDIPASFKLTTTNSADATYIKVKSQDITYIVDDKYGVSRKAFGAYNNDSPAKFVEGKHDDITLVSSSALTNDAKIINALLAAGEFMQLPVHRGILFGDEAMIKLNYEGLSDAPRIIIKPLGSAGVLDPLDQRQSVGYRVDGFGLAIKRPEAICITYGIPVNAEFAALTTAYMVGHPVLLDNSQYGIYDASTNNFANTYAEDNAGNKYQRMNVAAVNQTGSVDVNAPNSALVTYPTFDSSANYEAGDIVTKDDVVYVFIKAHTGAWAAKDVVKVNGLYTNLLDTNNDKGSNVR